MSQTATPPQAAIRPRQITLFGETLHDDYFWLRERENPEVLALIEAENAYTEQVLNHTEALQQTLYNELVQAIVENDQTAPAQDGPYRYYQRTIAGQQYKLHCRTLGSDRPEQILIDENELAVGQTYFRMGVFRVSPDQRYLAYSTDTNGSERFNLYIKDLTTGDLVGIPIPNVSYDVEWADNSTLLYAIPDDAWRTYKLFRHTIGHTQSTDTLVYHETDPAYWLHLRKTRSGAYLVLHAKSNSSSEIMLLPTSTPQADFMVVFARQPDIEMMVDHHDAHIYVMSNADAPTFQVVRIPLAQLDAPPEIVVACQPDVTIVWIELFARHLVVFERDGGLEHLRVVELATGASHRVALPEPIYALNETLDLANLEYDTNLFRFGYSSMVTPLRIYDYDMHEQRLILVKQYSVPGYNPDEYMVERIWATASDGVHVPISVVRPRTASGAASSPLYLYGYGAYGASSDPSFDHRRLPLLRRGIICAIAHVRGGSEMGRHWYEDGKLRNKPNTFTDFIACAEHLIAQGYTRPDLLVIKGRSAGGLLMGAVTTMRPDLFKAVIAGVPFVDVINTSLDPSIPLVVNEYEEWGDPNNHEHYLVMRTYSPYENTIPQAYPSILATAGLYDPRVQYWEPAKWVQKLRRANTNQSLILLRTELVGGHSGPSGRYDYLREYAFEFAFFLNALGMTESA